MKKHLQHYGYFTGKKTKLLNKTHTHMSFFFLLHQVVICRLLDSATSPSEASKTKNQTNPTRTVTTIAKTRTMQKVNFRMLTSFSIISGESFVVHFQDKIDWKTKAKCHELKIDNYKWVNFNFYLQFKN